MGVAQLFEEAKKLSPAERDELAALLLDIQGDGNLYMTGAEIVAMLESMPPIDTADPDILDPVEWVRAQRRK